MSHWRTRRWGRSFAAPKSPIPDWVVFYLAVVLAITVVTIGWVTS